jgi:hypothetical protein
VNALLYCMVPGSFLGPPLTGAEGTWPLDCEEWIIISNRRCDLSPNHADGDGGRSFLGPASPTQHWSFSPLRWVVDGETPNWSGPRRYQALWIALAVGW